MAVNNKKINNSDNIEQENFVLGNIENDLKNIKGLKDIRREDFKRPEVFKELNELSSFFINNPNLLDFLQGSVAREEELIASKKEVPENLKKLNKIISNLENELGLDKQDILAAYKSHDEKISLEAKSEVLKLKKTIKIGNKEFPLATLIRIPAYLAGTVAVSLTTAGIAGIAGVALFRNLEKYISDKKDKKNIEIKAKEIRKKLDEKKLTSIISSSLFIRKLEKEENISSEDFLINKTKEERNKIISDFVDIKYSQVDSDIKNQIVRKFRYQFEIEKFQIEKEDNCDLKPSGAMEKVYSFLTKKDSSSVESRAIRSVIVSGAIITTGRIAREIPVVKNILGAYLGWNLGGLVDNIVNKKETVSGFDEQSFASELTFFKNNYEEYKKNISESGDGDVHYIELFDELFKDLERLESSRARALLELEKNSLKDVNPGRYLFIKKNIDEASKYIHLIRARFNSVDLNQKKEDILLQNKKSQEISKLKSSLFKAGGLVLGALTPSIVSLITENVNSSPIIEAKADIQSDDFFSDIKSPDFFQYPENGGSETASVDSIDSFSADDESSLTDSDIINIEGGADEISIENNVDIDGVNSTGFEKINEIVGTPQKSIILESGDGISKIFDGNMSSNYKVNFIDEQTGEVFEATAGSKIIHPGDEVILGEDGNVNVICKQGIVDNPRYIDNYLPEENIIPEKMVVLKPEEIKISSEINFDNNAGNDTDASVSEVPVTSNSINNQEEDIVFEKPEYELTRSSDGKLTIEKLVDNDISDNNIVNNENVSENTETLTLDNSGNVESISDPNALRLDYDENGRIVLKDSGGNIIKGSSSDKTIDDSDIESGKSSDILEKNSESIELDEGQVEDLPNGFADVNEGFNSPESFKKILGEDFSNLKIIEKVDNLGNRLGFSLRDPETGRSVDISFPRSGGIRMEEGLNDKSFGNLKDNFDEITTEERALIVESNNNGAFSVEDFRSGLKKILE